MDRLEAMSLLVAAVEAGSLSAAARKLGAPLTTVSRKVADLEAHLGTRLLNRSSRRMTLTDAGAAYVAACRRILSEVEQAEREAAGEFAAPRGELTISAPIVFGRLHIAPVVVDFLAAYPAIDVRLSLTDRVVNLHEERVDLAARIARLPDSSLLATRVGQVRRVLCAAPRYLEAHGTPQAPRDLLDHVCILSDSNPTPDGWIFTRDGVIESAPIRPRLIVDTAEAAIDAAIAGLGITSVLSYQVAKARRRGLLTLILRDFEPEPSPVSLVHAPHGLSPRKLRAFIDFAAPRLRAGLASLEA